MVRLADPVLGRALLCCDDLIAREAGAAAEAAGAQPASELLERSKSSTEASSALRCSTPAAPAVGHAAGVQDTAAVFGRADRLPTAVVNAAALSAASPLMLNVAAAEATF